MGWNANWVRGGPVEMSAFSGAQWPGPPLHLSETAAAPSQRGRIETVTVTLGEEVDEFTRRGLADPINIWLPPGYDDSPSVRYPTVYVSKGREALDPRMGRWRDSLDRTVGTSFAPLIVVFLNDTLPQRAQAAPLVAFVDQKYRTLPQRSARALISMGMISFEPIFRLGMESDLFEGFGIQCFFGFEEEAEQALQSLAPERQWRGYLEWGSLGIRSPSEGWDMRRMARDVYEGLAAQGVTMSGGEVAATTEWKSWRQRTHVMLGALFPPAEPKTP
jgi:hypothetical protein